MSDGLQPLHYANKKKRSRLGCITCRTRKVKCDERANQCANCEKLHLECQYDRTSPSRKSRSGRRIARACNNCRTSRSKCTGERPVCSVCRQVSLDCSYEDAAASSTPIRTPLSSGPMSTSSESQSVSRAQKTGAFSQTQNDMPRAAVAWLNHSHLPETKHVRLLVTHYFQNFHPLRCFGFVHKPTFLRRLDDELLADPEKSPLLHIMCTLGAQSYALEYSDTVEPLPKCFILCAGRYWAKTAQRLLFDNMDSISVDGLMCVQLLYDYALRMANFTQAFMLSAIMVRMTQALQINLEYSSDLLNNGATTALSTTMRESRRRLMWSCYVTDVLCGSGVDQLTMVFERDLKIQLPCNDWAFLHEKPIVTRTLYGQTLPFLTADTLPKNLDVNMGMAARFVQQIEIRRRVLRYIKHLDEAQPPWIHSSEFAMFDDELRRWYDSLPPDLGFTSSTIYMRKESNQLGALCVFHCAYHQTMCDLYRLGTPELYKLRSSFHFPAEQADFVRHLQWALFKEARTLAAIIAEAERHGPRNIGDSWLPTIAYDSNRIMLFYLCQVTNPIGVSKRELVLSTIPYLQSNLRALKAMTATNAIAEDLALAAENMLEQLGVSSETIKRPLPHVILDDPYLALISKDRHSVPGTPQQSAPDYVLNPLSIFRMARSHVPEGHAPESIDAQSTDDTPRSSNAASTGTPRMLPGGFSANQSSIDQAYEEGFDFNLDMFFAPNIALDWQPPETIVGSSMEGEGLLPWVMAPQLSGFNYEASASSL